MLSRVIIPKLIILGFGGIFLSYTPANGYNPQQNRPSNNQNPANNQSQRQEYGREEIAQADSYPYNQNYDYPDYNRNSGFERMSDWDNKETWRYNRGPYYRGETQSQVYREQHPYGPGGIGYDADENWSRENKRRMQMGYRQNGNSNYQNNQADQNQYYQQNPSYQDYQR